jgi:hypothetical protein
MKTNLRCSRSHMDEAGCFMRNVTRGRQLCERLPTVPIVCSGQCLQISASALHSSIVSWGTTWAE